MLGRRVLYRDLDIIQLAGHATGGGAGYAALRECCHLGRLVAVACPNGRELGPLLVVDCAREADAAWLDGIRFAVDLFGRELWAGCAVAGETAWVRVRGW